MSKFERRRFFEELCRLRALYRLRSEYDATPVMSVDDTVTYAIELLGERLAAALPAGIAPEESTRNSSSSR